MRGIRLKILNPPNDVILVPAFAGINCSGNPELSIVSPEFNNYVGCPWISLGDENSISDYVITYFDIPN